ncbi:hypothetical protein, partial [Methylomonas methanica]|uniref:hypothetical protein n=1 Tax=Methylomonas methanica TaxID=421 RepID=UPI001E3DFCB4
FIIQGWGWTRGLTQKEEILHINPFDAGPLGAGRLDTARLFRNVEAALFDLDYARLETKQLPMYAGFQIAYRRFAPRKTARSCLTVRTRPEPIHQSCWYSALSKLMPRTERPLQSSLSPFLLDRVIRLVS